MTSEEISVLKMNQKYLFDTPILFLVFNRPNTTQMVFERIREVKPKYLFIGADGPRAEMKGEKELCEEVRRIVLDIDWECEVETLFRDTNLGCGQAVSQAISWFFEQVDQGIILEDDCLPEPTFFPFCEKLLAKYKTEERVMHIAGSNFQLGRKRGTASYYYSRYTHVWGWATWERAWNKYDFDIVNYNNNYMAMSERSKFLRVDLLDKVRNGEIDTWDVQWSFCVNKENGVSIIPQIGLVKNIGFGSGTHFRNYIPKFYTKMKFGSIEKIVYPDSAISPCRRADLFTKRVIHPKTIFERIYSRVIQLLPLNPLRKHTK